VNRVLQHLEHAREVCRRVAVARQRYARQLFDDASSYRKPDATPIRRAQHASLTYQAAFFYREARLFMDDVCAYDIAIAAIQRSAS
jgi:hypothetical protein